MTRFLPALSRRVASTVAALGAGSLLLISLAGCAPAASDSPDLKPGDASLALEDWRQQIDDCMLDAGFDLTSTDVPEGSIDVSQFDMTKFDAAYAGCVDVVGEAPIDDSIPTDEEIFESQLIFAACMREKGYDYPDPEPGSIMSPAIGSDVDPDVVDTCSAQAYEDANQ